MYTTPASRVLKLAMVSLKQRTHLTDLGQFRNLILLDHIGDTILSYTWYNPMVGRNIYHLLGNNGINNWTTTHPQHVLLSSYQMDVAAPPPTKTPKTRHGGRRTQATPKSPSKKGVGQRKKPVTRPAPVPAAKEQDSPLTDINESPEHIDITSSIDFPATSSAAIQDSKLALG